MWYKHWDTIPPTFRAEYSELIREQIPAIRKAAHNKGWSLAALSNTDRFFSRATRLNNGMHAVIINGQYLFMYAVVNSWWSVRPILCEEFLLSLKRGGNFGDCLAVIERIAKDEGCGSVCIGTAAAPSNAAYERLLNRHGYKTLAYQLVKEV